MAVYSPSWEKDKGRGCTKVLGCTERLQTTFANDPRQIAAAPRAAAVEVKVPRYAADRSSEFYAQATKQSNNTAELRQVNRVTFALTESAMYLIARARDNTSPRTCTPG
eukprot:COSAG02_NODE_21358_length_791_cov_1.904624_1_plen_109_part_00